MALVLYDRVQQTGTANTTVSFTLSGSVTGYQSFSVIGNTNTTYYGATDSSGNWETGVGTYSTTGPTLTRTTILASSNSNSAVTFSGTVTVFVTYPAGKSINADASNVVNTPGAIIAPQAGSIIPFYFANQAAFPSAATCHGALAHSHSDGAMYFAHGGVWVRLFDYVVPSTAGNVLTSNGTTWVSSTPTSAGATKAQAIAYAMIFGY
jgi:hypothetical protein